MYLKRSPDLANYGQQHDSSNCAQHPSIAGSFANDEGYCRLGAWQVLGCVLGCAAEDLRNLFFGAKVAKVFLDMAWFFFPGLHAGVGVFAGQIVNYTMP